MIRYLIIGLLLLVSCTDDVERLQPKGDVMPRAKMVEVLKELIKVEGYVTDKYVSVDQFHLTMIESGDEILKEQGITKEQLEDAFTYYGSRQKEMQSIYDEVLEELNAELWELQSDKTPSEKKTSPEEP